ncbi:hypothetical protein [Gillisia sp. JM1]|uniref:hypothetical protein n=1 Tax=Gillisia sp. JM1 TaxID=1283286 RepID=UPI00047D9604|nr:hypothetical protein [Gillisia sp. JM1]
MISLISCQNKEKPKYSVEELQIIRQESYQRDLDNRTSLLSFMNNIENSKVQIVLLEYMKEIHNSQYQVITSKSFNIEEYERKMNSELNLNILIPEIAHKSGLSNSSVSKIIYDNTILEYRDDFDAIYDEVIELRESIKYPD